MKKILALLLLLAGTMVLGGCSLYATQQGAPSPAAVEPDAVNIQNFSFNPPTLTVKKGATVTWTSNDSAPHQIKSATFNSGEFQKGQTYSFTFNETGTFEYSCFIHPSMLGEIIVE